jgi:hypothetical protein
MGLNNLPPESKCLLEIDPADLFCRTTEKVQYWLNATLAARRAGERALEVSNGKTASWLEIQSNEQYSHLPTTYAASEEGDGEAATEKASSSTATRPTPTTTKAVGKAPTAKRVKPNPPPPAALAHAVSAPARGRDHEVDTTSQQHRLAARQAQLKRRQGIKPPKRATKTSGLRLTTAYTSAVPKHDRDLVGQALQVRLPTRPDGTVIDRDFIRREGFQMQYGSFLTLRPSTWLNDEVINYAMGRLINPLCNKLHCYSSHFFSRCLKRTADGLRFDYDGVKRWSGRIPGGLASLDDLYVPINKNNAHWLFLRVQFRTQIIELYDSLGVKPSNSLYLETMVQYLCFNLGDDINSPCAACSVTKEWTLSSDRVAISS